MKICVVIGGSGFIGKFLLRDLASRKGFDRVYNLDLVPDGLPRAEHVYVPCDARRRLEFAPPDGWDPAGSWIVNLAAVCREPGYPDREYFDTNAGSAERVTAWAALHGFRNILFTSTMSTYGRMPEPTSEDAPRYPETPYGISKVMAESTHRIWLAEDPGRRLIICRPGVIFGPGDFHNIPRMINAIRKGYFVFPGDPEIIKAYGYVYGLVESFAFTLAMGGERLIIYNYAENPLLNLRQMADAIGNALGKKVRVIRLPNSLLVAAASAVQAVGSVAGFNSPIHPVRVRKVAFPTHMHPKFLIDRGFPFRYGFEEALKHWSSEDPAFFGK